MADSAIELTGERRETGQRPFHGWYMVAAAFVVMMVGFGAAYSFPVFFEPLASEFSAGRGDTSMILSISGFLYFFLGLWSGTASDRIGARPVVIFGTLVCATGLLLASRAESLWQVYWGYGLGVGVGVGCMYVPAVGVVQRWFARRRSTASGLAITGIGVGTFFGPLAAHELIVVTDWRMAYVVLAAVVAVLGVGAALVLVNSPASRGQFPDGADRAPGGAEGGPSLSLSEARRTFPFWMILISASAISIGLFVPFGHLVPFALDLGLSPAEAATVFSGVGIGSIFGRMALGPIAQAWGRQPVLVILYLGLAVGFVGWNFATTFIELMIFSIAFGTLYGGFVALSPTVLADYFGVGHIGSIVGNVYASVALGALLGPAIAGYLYDVVGTYQLPIMVGAVLCLIAAALIVLPKSPFAWREARFGPHAD